MDRRTLLTTAAALPLMGCAASTLGPTERSFRRVRPGDPGWPSDAQWEALNRTIGGGDASESWDDGLNDKLCTYYFRYY